MRYGRLIAALVSALVVLATAAVASAGGLVKVSMGRWDGTAWRLAANDQVSGVNVSYCWKVTFVPDSSGGCASYIGQDNSPYLRSYGMDIGESLHGCPGVSYADGPVTASASSVEITLSTGGVVHTSTIAAPAGLARSIRFFVARIPCGSQPETATGRNAGGSVVALFPNAGV